MNIVDYKTSEYIINKKGDAMNYRNIIASTLFLIVFLNLHSAVFANEIFIKTNKIEQIVLSDGSIYYSEKKCKQEVMKLNLKPVAMINPPTYFCELDQNEFAGLYQIKVKYYHHPIW